MQYIEGENTFLSPFLEEDQTRYYLLICNILICYLLIKGNRIYRQRRFVWLLHGNDKLMVGISLQVGFDQTFGK